jgi:hypothetical protein
VKAKTKGESMPQHIPDWPSFEKKHIYAIATAGSDGWEASPPLTNAIQQDIRSAAEDCLTDEEADRLLDVDWRDWINSLCVFERRSEKEVATFNITLWRWQTAEEWQAWHTSKQQSGALQ